MERIMLFKPLVKKPHKRPKLKWQIATRNIILNSIKLGNYEPCSIELDLKPRLPAYIRGKKGKKHKHSKLKVPFSIPT